MINNYDLYYLYLDIFIKYPLKLGQFNVIILNNDVLMGCS